jgi:hypothetical protein
MLPGLGFELNQGAVCRAADAFEKHGSEAISE